MPRRITSKYYPDDNTALKLDVIILKCIDLANRVYGTSVKMTSNKTRILILHDLSAVTAQILQILDTICLTNNRAEVIVNANEEDKFVTVKFRCDGICDGMELKFDLYTGVPGVVVSDDEAEEDMLLEAAVLEAFEKLTKIRKNLKCEGNEHE